MIYVLSGNDTKKKNIYLKKLCKGEQAVFLNENEVSKEALFNFAMSTSLFGEAPIVVCENFIKNENVKLNAGDLSILKDSPALFIFLEEKILANDLKTYKKYATTEDFNTTETKQNPKINVFGIADSFAKKDKVGTWILYREAISFGVSPEEITGIIFWKIKTMILTGTKIFSSDELKTNSSTIVALYHNAHRGESDFTISLEQFILSSLSK
jgi:DNA polymerase III delta subunit